MRKILMLVLVLVAASTACNTKPTREQCVEYTKPLVAEVLELRDLNARWRENNYRAIKLINLLKARADRKE